MCYLIPLLSKQKRYIVTKTHQWFIFKMAILEKEKWKIDSRNEQNNRKEGEKKTIFFKKARNLQV